MLLCQNWSDSKQFSIVLALDLTWETLTIFSEKELKRGNASWTLSSGSKENSAEADNNSSHSVDAFIDKLVKRKVTIFLEREIVISALKLLQLGYKSKGLQVIALFQFDGDLYK